MTRPEPTRTQLRIRGWELAEWRWPAAGTPAGTVLLLHATGFHSRTWDAVVDLLPPRIDVRALDLRGHGYSETPASFADCNWREFAHDVDVYLEHRGIENAVVAGHSMGGAVAVLAALRSERIAALVLVDPVIPIPDWRGETPANILSAGARKRRARWPSPEAMADSFADRGPFQHWPRRLVELYAEHALIPDHGEWRLRCPPRVEAMCFDWASPTRAYDELHRVRQPTTILRPAEGGPLLPNNPGPRAAEVLPNGRDIAIGDTDHFIPQRTPEPVAEQIAAAVAGSVPSAL